MQPAIIGCSYRAGHHDLGKAGHTYERPCRTSPAHMSKSQKTKDCRIARRLVPHVRLLPLSLFPILLLTAVSR
jgi:hypothetical protein